MVIEFNGLNPSNNSNNKTKQVDGAKKGEPQPNPVLVGDGDGQPALNVEISSTSKKMQSLEDKVKSLPDVDQERVDQVKARIAQGEYQPNPQAIAENIIATDNSR